MADTKNPVITAPTNDRREEEKKARRRRIARRVALALGVGAITGMVGGGLYNLWAGRRMLRELGDSNDWRTLGYIRRKRYIPLFSRVLKPAKPNPTVVRVRNIINKLLGVTKPTHGAEHSQAVLNMAGAPIFYLGNNPKMVSERVARHEGGHYKAQQSRSGGNAQYIREYLRAQQAAGGWSDIFNPGRLRDSQGRPTLVGLEQEAWDLGGVPASDKLRNAAVGTYKAHAATRSLNRYMRLAAAASVPASIYGYSGNATEEDAEKPRKPASKG